MVGKRTLKRVKVPAGQTRTVKVTVSRAVKSLKIAR
jgi:hypothetical protein